MTEIVGCMIAEIRAMGLSCFIHGPEIWLVLVAWCIFCIGFVCGMFVASLLMANRR